MSELFAPYRLRCPNQSTPNHLFSVLHRLRCPNLCQRESPKMSELFGLFRLSCPIAVWNDRLRCPNTSAQKGCQSSLDGLLSPQMSERVKRATKAGSRTSNTFYAQHGSPEMSECICWQSPEMSERSRTGNAAIMVRQETVCLSVQPGP